jgi:peptidoglycan/xylan/chitin deacetylase (PgdA/CDA1 family)
MKTLVRNISLLFCSAIMASWFAGCHGRGMSDAYWKSAREDVYKSADQILNKHEADLKKGLKRHVFLRGKPGKKHLALTFDDGPHPQYTRAILEILDRYKAKATFFLVGELAEAHPDLVRAEAAAGHCIANHTYHHVNLTRVPPDMVATEIMACGKVLKAITGEAPRFFRPPGGNYDDHVLEVAEALGYDTVLWTDDPGDYASPGTRNIEGYIFENISDGGIILIHDGIQQTIDALPRILDYLQDRGFEFVAIDEMVREKNEKQAP